MKADISLNTLQTERVATSEVPPDFAPQTNAKNSTYTVNTKRSSASQQFNACNTRLPITMQ
jgi:hypothetical protein